MRALFSSLFLIMICITGAAQTQIEDIANSLGKHKFKKVYRCFSDNMKNKISQEQIEKIWKGLEETGGSYVALENIETKEKEGGSFQTGLVRFEELAMRLELSTNEDDEITGLFVRQLGYAPPKYAEGLGVGKEYITLESHGYSLPGELVIPLNCTNCPVVILVHGSGPNDKDETIGPNKVFFDMAMGLARQGVASFRYDKRSKVYPEMLNEQFDIYDETINDAISAFKVLKNDTSLYFGKHILLGHSLGAYAIPLIADSLGGELDGAILFSANARRLEDLIEYQMEYLTNYDNEIDADEAEFIKKNTLKAAKIRNGEYSLDTKADALLAYWPGKFWKGISNYNPVSKLSNNQVTPFYILQGEKDYQITMTDFNLWEDGVGNQPNVSLKSYPNLTHLFTPSSAKKPGPNDYFVPQNVSYEVIQDIAEWSKAL